MQTREKSSGITEHDEESKEAVCFGERYIGKSILGQGSRGTVWLVENVNTKGIAAMKLYKKGSPEAKRELRVLGKLGGKGIPYLIDGVEIPEYIGIVMEYVEGKSLRSLMKEQKIWTEKGAMEIAIKIAKVLSVFHKQIPAMIYGDLKPENIMVTSEGEVYLIDFGSVIFEGERDQKIFGTREYLPPSEEGKILPHRDTYGLGVILYEMLTGYRIQEGMTGGKADIAHLSSPCRKVMQKAVRICEREGYADAGQMYEDLKACYEEYIKNGERGRKKSMEMKKRKGLKNDYFIGDLKRLALHGYIRILGLIVLGVLFGGIVLRGREIEAAEMPRSVLAEKESVFMEGLEEHRNDLLQEGQRLLKNEKATADGVLEKAENLTEKTVVRDEYGRKLVMRKVN
ncbi:MAG: serine/threonine protein kinase [Lachnospiraceae bacterium]|nr:serine/threonine protein kinase [Lachnospiraceae bacterium]